MYKMPTKLFMNLQTNNSNDVSKYLAAYNQIQSINALNAAKHTSLKTPMIGRIHNIRPGCGSCGR
jgi:hypothetical protein